MEQDPTTELRNIISARFSAGELRTLCDDLRIDYDDLPPGGKSDKVRELIQYLNRRSSLPRLIEAGRHLRPDIDWNGVAELIEAVPPATGIYEAPPEMIEQHRSKLTWGLATAAILAVVAAVLGVDLLGKGREAPVDSTHTPTLTQAHTPTSTQAPTVSPTLATVESVGPLDTPTPAIASDTPTPALPVVEIVFIEYDPEGSDLEGEYVFVRNTTDVAQDLAGWTIEDADAHTFCFPPFVLEPGASVKVWTTGGQDTPEDLYWGFGSAVWTNDGDTATLKDYRGQVVATYTYPQ